MALAALDATLFGSADVAAICSFDAFIARMLVFEAALARAEARAGVIPASAAAAIAAVCESQAPVPAEIAGAAVKAGTPVIPLVAWLSARVGEDGKGFVHWGATSQDVIDTALMLQLRDGLELIRKSLAQLATECARLAHEHRQTVMAGRTLLQQALPITFGLKAARWLALVCRQIRALRAVRDDTLALQFGGAAGTLAAFGEKGMVVSSLLAQELGLPEPELPWHGEQDRFAGVAAAVGVVAGAMGKMAGDLILLTQTEVGEVAEGAEPGKGGSSAMPQKRNPVDSIEAAAAARRALGLVPVVLSAMVQEHERAAGAWQSTWSALPELFVWTAGTVEHVRATLSGLEVDTSRMRANLELTNGRIMSESLVMALSPHTGRDEAQQIVRAIAVRAEAGHLSLLETTAEDARIRAILTPDEIRRALDPTSYLGASDAFIDRALAAFESI